MLTTDKILESPEFIPKFEAWRQAERTERFHEDGFDEMLRDRAGDWEDVDGYGPLDYLGTYKESPADAEDFLIDWLKPYEIAVYTETIPRARQRTAEAAEAIENLGRNVGLHSFALSGLCHSMQAGPGVGVGAMREAVLETESRLQEQSELFYEQRGARFFLDYYGFISVGQINDDECRAIGKEYECFLIPSEPGMARPYTNLSRKDIAVPRESWVVPVSCIMENAFEICDAADLLADSTSSRIGTLDAKIFFGALTEGPADVTSIFNEGGIAMKANIEYHNRIVKTARDIVRKYSASTRVSA